MDALPDRLLEEQVQMRTATLTARIAVLEEELAQQTALAEQNLLDAVTQERHRLAGEIHDTLAQSFTGILIQLGVAQRIGKQDPVEAWNLVERVTELARQGLAEARRSIWSLQANRPQYRDLARMLPLAIAEIAGDTVVPIEVQIQGTPHSLPSEIGQNLLRIGQEALKNALSHAVARRIRVRLLFDSEHVELSVQDDGKGFDPHHIVESFGFGLIGIQQRTARIGGRLALETRRGHGTKVTVTVPLASYREGDITI